MILFDVNILIYAHRADQTHHGFYRERLEQTLAASEPCAISAAVATGFVRIVTQPKFPNGPTPLSEALAVIDSLAAPGICQWLQPGIRHWHLVAELCRTSQAAGKIVSDASHAALAIEHACTWITRDTDFERFKPNGLRLEIWAAPGE